MKPALAQTRILVARLLGRLPPISRRGLARALVALPLLFLLYALALIPFTPGISDIRKAKSEQPAQVLSSDGKLLAEFKRANREWVPLADVSPQVVAALIATEDHRFYQHWGLDWRRTASAALKTLAGDRQGGSTITQQLARNLYPEEIGRAPTLTRKIKEAITALKIEALYSKDEILETYLNTVPFLYNAYGIEMAARTYFDTSARRLDLLQSATLIGMLKGTSYYNPVLNPERALQRRNTVLAQMVKRQKLERSRYEALKGRPLRLDFERQSEPPGPAPHFAQQLRKWLIDWADRNDYDIHADGLVVRTTVDARLQAWANQAVARHGRLLQSIADAAWAPGGGWSLRQPLVQALLRETPEYRMAREAGLTHEQALKRLQADGAFMRALREHKTRIQAGFLALDPRSGQVRAWVGSRDFAQDAYDHVQQARRQPGSTFKPFVYGAALLKGASPEDRFVDQAVEMTLSGGEVWRPADDQPPSGREMSLRDALAYSKNTITAQLMQTVGAAEVARLARAMGVRESRLELVPSLALGTSPVTLKEMVSAYGTLANGGAHVEPVMVTRIEDREGRVLARFSPDPPEAVLPHRVAYQLVDMLRGVVERGTGAAIRNRWGLRADLAGKTGTTQDYADGWFILMHPQLVAGAWVGFNDSRITLRSDHWGQGAHSALPMVGDFFQQALRQRAIDPQARFAEPDETGILSRLWRSFKSRWDQLFASEPEPKPRRPARPAPPPEAASAASAAPESPASAAEELALPPAAPASAPLEPLTPVQVAPQPPAEGPVLLPPPGTAAPMPPAAPPSGPPRGW